MQNSWLARGFILLKVPYCTHFWSFILGVDVLKNIYLRYKYQNPSQYILQLFSQELCWKQGCVQPRQNGAKRLLNGNSGALNTLFWWRNCGSWEGQSLCSFWRIFGAWWNRYKYVINIAKYTQCYSHCPCLQNKREHPHGVKGFVETGS